MRLVPSSKRTCFTFFAARSLTKALYSTTRGALARSAERRAATARAPSAADAATKTAKKNAKARDAKRDAEKLHRPRRGEQEVQLRFEQEPSAGAERFAVRARSLIPFRACPSKELR